MAAGAVVGSAIGTGSSLGGSLFSSIGSYVQPNIAKKTAKKEYGYLSALTRAQMVRDKAVAERNISLVQDQGMRTAAAVSKKAGMVEGAQKAASAGMGIGGGSVTTANLLNDTRIQANLDKIAIRYKTDLQAWKIQNESNYEQYVNTVKLQQYDYAVNVAKHNAKMSNMAFGISILGGYVGLTNNTAASAGSMIASMGSQPQTQNTKTVSGIGMTSTNFMDSTAYRQAYGNQVPTYGRLTGPASVGNPASTSIGKLGSRDVYWNPTKLE